MGDWNGISDFIEQHVPMVRELKKAAGYGGSSTGVVGPQKNTTITPEGSKYLDDAIEEARKRAVERGQIKDTTAPAAAV